MMVLRYFFTAVVLFSAACAMAAEPVALNDKLASCGICHTGKLALTGKTTEEVLAGINRIRAGQRAHPPGLQVFEPDELAEVAAILSGAASAEAAH